MTDRPGQDGSESDDSAEVRTYLKQSAIALVRLCRKHFGITGKGDRLKVEATVRPDDVTAFMREYIARVRPRTLSESRVLPQPNDSALRTFLWARPFADAVLNDVVRLSLYSDEIVVIDPFSMHVTTIEGASQPPMGPLQRPELWIQEFPNHALMVCALEDWIANDLVLLVPEPRHFIQDAPPFMLLAARAVREGKLSLKVGPDLVQDALEGSALNTDRDEDLPAMLKDVLPAALSRTEREAIYEAMRAYRRVNPTRYSLRPPETGTVFSMASGQNIFEAAWIADAVGGYLVPRLAYDRANFRLLSRGDRAKDDTDALASAFAQAPLPMLNNVSLSDALDLRKTGRLARFRTFLHDVWAATSDPAKGMKTVERERDLATRLKGSYAEAREEWSHIYRDLGLNSAVAIFASSGLTQVVEAGVVPVAAGAIGWLFRQWSGPTRAFRRNAAGLLVQLENQSSPNPVRRAVDAIERKL
jgi:hypothetical protein